MQIVRTVVWVLLLVTLIIFTIFNWKPVEVMIWPFAEEGQRLLWVTNIAAIVIVSFLIGLVPMYLYHRASKWSMRRKIASLENAARTAAATPVATNHEVEAEPVRTEPDVRADPATPLKPTPVAEPAPAASDEPAGDDLFASDSGKSEPKA